MENLTRSRPAARRARRSAAAPIRRGHRATIAATRCAASNRCASAWSSRSATCASRRTTPAWAPRAARRSARSRAAPWAAAAARSRAPSAARSWAASSARTSSSPPTSSPASRSRCCSTPASTSPSCRAPTSRSAPGDRVRILSGRGAHARHALAAHAPPRPRYVRWSRMVGHAALAAFLLRTRLSAPRRRAPAQAPAAGGRRSSLRILNVSMRVEGPAPGVHERGAMIAANHVSWLDIFLISSVRPTRFIAKSEIREWAMRRAGSRKRAGHALHPPRPVARHRTHQARSCTRRSPTGECVGLFPEGITTEGDVLLKFHSSLFRARRRQRRARASRGDPLRAARRVALPRDFVSRRAHVHGVAAADHRRARGRGANRVRGAGGDDRRASTARWPRQRATASRIFSAFPSGRRVDQPRTWKSRPVLEPHRRKAAAPDAAAVEARARRRAPRRPSADQCPNTTV